MSTHDALACTARVLATRELRCWEGEYSPEPEQYAAAHTRAVAQLRDPAGPLAPLLAVLAQTERERDDARARIARYVAAYDAWIAADDEATEAHEAWLHDATFTDGPRERNDAAIRAERETHAACNTALAALRETPAVEGER